MPTILVPLANGVEEIEAVIAIDVLRRARWSVTSVSMEGQLTVTASRGVKLVADTLWKDLGKLNRFDGIVIPGGAGGTQALCAHEAMLETLKSFNLNKKCIGAICAGPLVLQAAGLLAGRRFTCYPGVEKDIHNAFHSPENVVRDGNLITSRGPGTAFEFALALIAEQEGDGSATALRRQLVLFA